MKSEISPSKWPISDPLPQPLAPTSRHILRHPDRHTTWIVTGTIWFTSPLGTGTEESVRKDITNRIADIAQKMPITSAKLQGDWWVPGQPPEPILVDSADPRPPWLLRPFDLKREPPLRVAVGIHGEWFTIVAHHAAIDGVNAIPFFKILCGEEPIIPGTPPSMAKKVTPPLHVINRILRPADPVAHSNPLPSNETFANIELPFVGKGIKGKLASALVKSLCAHNARYGVSLERIGISASIMELDDSIPIASYRRIDIPPGAPIDETFEREISIPEEPWELIHAPRALRLLSPLTGRLSDTVLLSNFGRWSLQGVNAIELYPVARGRSAVSVAAVRTKGGKSLLTIRACYLNKNDARRILEETVAQLSDHET